MDDASQTIPPLITGFANDGARFKLFMQQHQKLVYNAALNLLQHHEDAEDITQDVFVDVYRNHGSFKGCSSVSTWLYKIAVNKSIDLLRKRERQRKWKSLGVLLGNTKQEPTDFVHPGTLAENREKAKYLYRALDKLPVNQRTAFLLNETSNLSYQQIGEVMGMTTAAVESVLFRAKSNLKKLLGQMFAEKDKI